MKKTLCVLLTALLLMTLTACGDSTDPGDSSESSSSSDSSSSSEQSSSGSEVEKKLNEDLLSDIGLTYSQLEEKRGELIKAGTAGGGVYYVFKQGYGHYFWDATTAIDWGEAPRPRDENYDFLPGYEPIPKEAKECTYIDYIKAQDLFLGLEETMSSKEIERSYGVIFDETTVNEMRGGYISYFQIDNLRIDIDTTEEGIITKESLVIISQRS